MKIFHLDAHSPTLPFTHYWELSVGSCHATTALRADWQKQLERCHKELGFHYVRFHGLFNDDMSVATRPMLSATPVFCFTNIDKVFDFLLSIGMKPFVELGFMPTCFASGDKTLFHYKANTTPPRDYDEWGSFIRLFIKHLVARYGREEVRTWFFEVWNEPNLGGPESPFGFWGGTQEDYWKLYTVTAEAVKSIDPAFKVGGPSTSNNAWLPEFLRYCHERGTPVDFVTTHHYPTDVVIGYGVENSINLVNPFDINDPQKIKDLVARVKGNPEQLQLLEKEYSVFRSHLWEHVERGVLTEMAKQARQEVGSFPLYYTEWGSLAGLPSDGPFGASFIAKTLVDNHGLVDGYSFWAFSDIFEEGAQRSEPFHGGFGLLTQHGIPKAPYRAFQLMHQITGELYEANLTDGTLDVHAFLESQTNTIKILVVNHQSLLHPIETEMVHIELTNTKPCIAAECVRIDEDHANPLAAWQAMGEPDYLSGAQLLVLESASCLEPHPVDFKQANGQLSLEITVPPMGIALTTLYFV